MAVKTLSVLGLLGLLSCDPKVAKSETVQCPVTVECAGIPCNS